MRILRDIVLALSAKFGQNFAESSYDAWRNLRKISPRVRRHILRHSRDVRTMFAQYSCEFLTTATAVRQLPDCRAHVAWLLQDVCTTVVQMSCNTRVTVMRCNLEGLPSPAIMPSYCHTRWASEKKCRSCWMLIWSLMRTMLICWRLQPVSLLLLLSRRPGPTLRNWNAEEKEKRRACGCENGC